MAIDLDDGDFVELAKLWRRRCMTSGEELADPRAPVFFLSYAHTGPRRGPSREVLRFFNDLSENINELIGRSEGAYPGFMDQLLAGGQAWESEVLGAVGTCSVFVPLLSSHLIDSMWCGKEWDAFAKRRLRPGHGNTAILPVKWTSVEIETMPQVVLEIQLFIPHSLPNEIVVGYKDDGVLGLLKTGRRSEYGAVVWRLAQQIVAISRSRRAEPSQPAFADLRNVFKEKD